eukprot:IDg2939t1
MAPNDGGKSELTYHTSALRPSLHIAERVWVPEAPAVASLVVIHGGTWHSGWFGPLGDMISALPGMPVRVSAPDLPAHGLSDNVIDGMRLCVPDFSELADEALAAVARARAAVGDDAKVFLLGESMGGMVAMCALVDKGLEVDGLILCGALLAFAPLLRPPAVILPILRVVAYFWPHAVFPSDIGGDTFDMAFGDPAMARLAHEDPLVCDKAPARIGNGVQLINAMHRVRKEAPDAVNINSVLFMHYTGDVRTSYEDAKGLVESLVHVDDKVFHSVDGTAHQLFQDVPRKVLSILRLLPILSSSVLNTFQNLL